METHKNCSNSQQGFCLPQYLCLSIDIAIHVAFLSNSRNRILYFVFVSGFCWTVELRAEHQAYEDPTKWTWKHSGRPVSEGPKWVVKVERLLGNKMGRLGPGVAALMELLLLANLLAIAIAQRRDGEFDLLHKTTETWEPYHPTELRKYKSKNNLRNQGPI